MTNQEIEKYRQRLVEIKKLSDSGERNKAYIDLITIVGASGCGGDKPTAQRDAENIASIHQALKTATMVNMCKTAAKNYKIAITASIIALLSALAAWAAVLIR